VKRSQQVSLIVASLSLALAIFGLGYSVEQTGFQYILPLYIVAFAAYFLFFWKTETRQAVRFLLLLGIGLRVLLLFSMPNLSDDIYRFVWDGRLWLNGINPFNDLPRTVLDFQPLPEGITPELFQQLNSPDYFTIYPPVAQGIFILASWLSPQSVWGSAIVMKLFLLACEIGSLILLLRLLKNFKLPEKNVLLYALNPLLIVEIMGNLHFEGAMIFFFLLAFWWLVHQKYSLSAIAFAFSIASKLLPLMFLPFLIRRLGWKRSLHYFSILGFSLLLLFLPLFNGVFLQNFGDSLNLYFQKFEFNASVYYIVRWIGFQMKGYNLIAVWGPRLAFGTFLGIMLLVILEKKLDWRSLPLRLLWASSLYLLFTTTVHPWYVSLPVVLCVFTRFRYPIIWSALIPLTYVNYSYNPYWENLWLVALEYIVVLTFLAWELFAKKRHLPEQLQNPTRSPNLD